MGKRLSAGAALLALILAGVACSRGPTDAQLAAKIKTQFSSDAQLKGASVAVDVIHAVATLTGQVPSVSARYEAFRLASQTAGVKRVEDHMTVQEAAVAAAVANLPPPAPAPETMPAAKPRRTRSHHRVRQVAPSAESSALESAPAESASPNTLPGYPVSAPASSSPGSASPPAVSASSAEPAPAPRSSAAPAPSPSAPPPVRRVTIPPNTLVSIRMVDTIDSAQNHTGDIFHASLVNPISVEGTVVAPRGADVYVRLVQASSAGHVAGQSELRLELYRMVIAGKSYPLVSNDYDVKGPSRSKRSALAIIGGAALGAAIGAIAGGGKGAAIGAAAGGGGGVVYEDATKSKQIRIPSETLLNFQLQQPIEVTLAPAIPESNP